MRGRGDTAGVFRHIYPTCPELQVCAPKGATRDPGEEVRQPGWARQDLSQSREPASSPAWAGRNQPKACPPLGWARKQRGSADQATPADFEQL